MVRFNNKKLRTPFSGHTSRVEKCIVIQISNGQHYEMFLSHHPFAWLLFQNTNILSVIDLFKFICFR